MAKAFLDVGNRRAQIGGIRTETHARHQAIAAFQPARQRGVLFLQTRDFRATGRRRVHQFLMRPPRLAQLASLVSGQDPFPQEIKQQRVESLEAVLIAQISSQQNVLLEKKHVVLAALDKDQAIGQYFVSGGHFIAEQRFPRSRQAVLFDLDNHLKNVLARLAENISPVRLQFSQPGFQYVRSFAAFKMLAAAANPFFPFQHEIRELRADFLRKEFQQRDTQQQVNLNIFSEFCSLQSRLEQVREVPLPGARLRRARRFPLLGLAFGLRKEHEIGVLPDELQKVRARQLDKLRAQKNVVVNIIHPNGQRAQRQLGDITLQVNPRGATRRGHG